jgi:hypothetical protein
LASPIFAHDEAATNDSYEKSKNGETFSALDKSNAGSWN